VAIHKFYLLRMKFIQHIGGGVAIHKFYLLRMKFIQHIGVQLSACERANIFPVI
jgi:hypothetical protein